MIRATEPCVKEYQLFSPHPHYEKKKRGKNGRPFIKTEVIEGRAVAGQIGCELYKPCWSCPPEYSDKCYLRY